MDQYQPRVGDLLLFEKSALIFSSEDNLRLGLIASFQFFSGGIFLILEEATPTILGNARVSVLRDSGERGMLTFNKAEAQVLFRTKEGFGNV